MGEDEPDILKMLIRHELVVKMLYDTFATMFKNYEGFWQNLAADEQKHIDLLTELQSAPITHMWLKHDSTLRPQAIKMSTVYVENQIAEAKEGRFSLLQALSIGRDIEIALLERHFSKLILDSTPKEIRLILMRLADETQRHLKAIVQVFDSERLKRS